MNNHVDLLAQAKQRLPLPALMALLGHAEHAKKSARCPFHDDSHNSFSMWQDADGIWRFKCHAGCGEGDEPDYLAKRLALSNADACREYIRRAGVSPPPSPNSSSSSQPPFNWQPRVAPMTSEHLAELTKSRGYAPKFGQWLHAEKHVGLFDGERIAFPVHDAERNVVGCHYLLKEDGSWRYHPTGTRVAPFIIGDLATAKTVYVFESQWDSLAALDALHHHIEPLAGIAAIATRGAGNGRLLAGLCAPDAIVYAFGQNDEAGYKWLAAVAANSGRKTFQVVTPAPHKDLNDWTRAGATAEEIRRAISEAQVLPASVVPDLHIAPARNLSKPVTVLRPDDEAAADAPKPFPVESLPPALAIIVSAVARCESAPVALPAVCALGVASAAIGAGLEIVSANDRVTRANLFLLADAESGSGKSQVFRRIAEPIVNHEHHIHETFRKETAPKAASEIGLLTREIKRLEGLAAAEEDPAERERMLGQLEFKRARLAELELKNVPPCVICADVTSEKLVVLLAANGETMFSASPEARQIVDIVCGRYNTTKSTDEPIYLSGFSGDFLRVDRLGREPVTLRKPCLTLTWLMQPDAMARLFDTESFVQSGFLARSLPCHTQATPKRIEGETEAFSDVVRERWAGLVAELLATYHAAEKPYRIDPSPEAKRVLDDFFNEVVDRRARELADVGPFASRYGEQAWRVALVFHAALYGRDAHNHPLHVETAESAIAVVRWFIDEQLGLLARGRREAAEKVEEEVLKLIESNRQRKGRDFVTVREVQQAHIVAGAGAARSLLERMEQAGLLSSEEIKPAAGGWTQRIYHAQSNPVPE